MLSPQRLVAPLIVLSFGVGASLGCGPAESDGGEPSTRRQGIECEKVPEFLDEEWNCFTDDDCPCGASCEFGSCGYECRDDDDCAEGRRCDSFGECRTPELAGHISSAAGEVRPALSLSPEELELTGADDSRRLLVGVEEADAPRVVVEAPQPVDLQCEPDGDWQSECLFEDLGVGEGPRRIAVRPGEGASGDVSGGLKVATADERRTVPVHFEFGGGGADANRQPGEYAGTARLASAGFASRSETADFPDPLTSVGVPVEATIYEGEAGLHVVEFEDELESIFPGGPTVATLAREGADGWRIEVPKERYAGPESPEADDLELAVAGESERVAWEGERLEFDFRSRVTGATTAERPLFVDWRISLTRTDPLSESATAPAEPTAYEPAFTAAQRAEQPRSAASEVEEALSTLYEGGPDAPTLAESLFCLSSTDESAVGLTGDVAINDADEAITSGDLACENGAMPGIVGMLDDSVVDLQQTVASCMADFERADRIRAGSGEDVLASEGCVDVARLTAILRHGFEGARANALGDQGQPTPAASALALRGLQQWLGFQQFFGRQVSQVRELGAVLPEAEALEADPDPMAVADRLVEAWDVLLHPRTAFALEGADPDVLADPDYRQRLHPDRTYGGRHQDQGIGIPVAILDGATGQLDYLNELVREARYRRVDVEDLDTRLRDVVRRSFVALALAQGLYDDVRSVEQPSWSEDWQLARRQFGDAVARLSSNLDRLRSGDNPLGIEDVDLPLYRIGDQQQPGERFYAISDYLVGDASRDGSAVAPSMVERAAEALDGARDAWLGKLEHDLAGATREAASERRLEAIRRDYGQRVTSLCGDPELDAQSALDRADEIDPDQCYLADSCQFDPEQVVRSASTAEIGKNVCVLGKLRDVAGEMISTGSRETDDKIDLLADHIESVDRGFGFHVDPVDPQTREIEFVADEAFPDDTPFSGETLDMVLAKVERSGDLPAGIDFGVYERIDRFCSNRADQVAAERPAENDGSCETSDDCAQGWICTPDQRCEPDTRPTGEERADCYRGSLGEAAYSLLETAREVEAARSRLHEHTERYDIAMRSCLIAKAGNDRIEDAKADHRETMDALGDQTEASRGMGLMADGARKVAGFLGDSDSDFFQGLGAIAGQIAEGNDAGAEAIRRWEGESRANRMRRARQRHEATVARIERETEEQRCVNDAEMHLVGVDTAGLEVERKTLELRRQMVEFQNLQRELERTLEEGQRALANERERTLNPLQIDFWLDDEIGTYRDSLRIAKRATYLAVRAVEYEFQTTLDQRDAVLQATRPGQLEDTLDNLKSFTGSGTVDGGAPDEALTVVSLRDELLQLADRSEMPDGFKNVSAEKRFQMLLNSPHFARHDEDGEYLGQQIPFTLAPVGRGALGSDHGISVLAGVDCAERLWALNASLQGDDLYQGSDTTFAQIVVRKRNTFYSQWCRAEDRDEPLQSASTRPKRNLFVDPYATEASRTTQAEAVATGSGTDGYTNARVSAYFNVSRADMEDEEYYNGDSQELAGRGLYGDYALFFPKQALAREGSSGLRLDRVEDILLRLDYVSVAKN